MIVARVLAVHVGKVAPIVSKPKVRSAIRKTAVEGPVRVGTYGAEGDEIGHPKVHGGPFKALCCYASEYYPLWHERFSTEMPLGSFGENLPLEGLLDDEVCIGDIYQIGSVKTQVAGPRGPCGNLSAHWNIQGFHRVIGEERETGFYLRTLEAGELQAGDAVELLERPQPDWNLVTFWERLEEGAREEIEFLAALDFLDPDWQPHFRRRLASLEKTGQ